MIFTRSEYLGRIRPTVPDCTAWVITLVIAAARPGRPVRPGLLLFPVELSTAVYERVQYIPPIPPPPGIGASLLSSGMLQTSASVVRSSDAIDDAFWSAERTTFAGSMTPAFTR